MITLKYSQNTLHPTKHPLIFKQIEKEQGIAPTFVSPMKIEYTQEESRAILTCQVHGQPTPFVRWYRAAELVVPNETVQQFYDDTTGTVALHIHNPEPNELIIYTIQAENQFGRAIGKAQLYVENAAVEPTPDRERSQSVKPEILRAPRVQPLEAQIVRTGSTLVLQSKYQGLPEPQIKWLKNGKEIPLDDEDVTIVTDRFGSTVTIRNMTRKRVGKYEIVATNKAGEARSSGSVVVSDAKDSTEELKAPRFTVPLQPKTVLDKDVVIMEAIVDSYPLSSFQWFHNSNPVQETAGVRIASKENKSILIVETFTVAAAGMYMCRAENVAGSVTSTASVTIVAEETQLEEVCEFISPRFAERLQPVQLMDGEELRLPCRVVGHPTPRIEWFRNDEVALVDAKGTQISQDTDGVCVLTISEVFPEDAGEYTCRATNKIGEASSTVSVIIEGII